MSEHEPLPERILVTDDDKNVRTLLARILKDAGYRVDQACCGEDALTALDAAGADPYAVLLLDLRMPGLSGLELIPLVRERSPDAAILMVTAIENVQIAVEALRRGACDYITKPFELGQVVDKTAEAAARRSEALREREYRADLEQRARVNEEHLAAKHREVEDALGHLEQARRELLAAHKLSSVGLLAQGIAHNMRGPLTAIAGFASMLRDKPDDPEKLDVIIQESRRLSGLVRNLLTKAKNDQDLERRPILINDLLKEELAFLEGHLFFKHYVERRVELGEGIEPFLAVYSDLAQALVSLIQNALDAMHGTEERVLTVRTRQEADHLVVEVGDTGVGILAEDLGKIFEPYFTTKAAQAEDGSPTGTGLGLYLTRRLLEKYQASISVRSRPGETVFTVRIPLEGNRVFVSGAATTSEVGER